MPKYKLKFVMIVSLSLYRDFEKTLLCRIRNRIRSSMVVLLH